MILYDALGLSLRSSESLSGLWRRSGEVGSSYYTIHVDRDSRIEGWAASAEPLQQFSNDVVTILEFEDRFLFRYADDTRFLVDRKRRTIYFCWDTAGSSLEDACTYLTGPVLGLVSGLEGFACFHGAAVVVDEVAVLILAASEVGKSTTAAAFALNGFDVLSDDVCAISRRHGSLAILPGFPFVRLWPESVELLFGSADALPLLTPNWTKRYLNLGAIGRFRSATAPLGGIVLLHPSGSQTTGADRLEGAGALLTMIGNSYPQCFSTRQIEARNLEIASEIVCRMPVWRIPAYLPPDETVRRIVESRRAHA